SASRAAGLLAADHGGGARDHILERTRGDEREVYRFEELPGWSKGGVGTAFGSAEIIHPGVAGLKSEENGDVDWQRVAIEKPRARVVRPPKGNEEDGQRGFLARDPRNELEPEGRVEQGVHRLVPRQADRGRAAARDSRHDTCEPNENARERLSIRRRPQALEGLARVGREEPRGAQRSRAQTPRGHDPRVSEGLLDRARRDRSGREIDPRDALFGRRDLLEARPHGLGGEGEIRGRSDPEPSRPRLRVERERERPADRVAARPDERNDDLLPPAHGPHDAIGATGQPRSVRAARGARGPPGSGGAARGSPGAGGAPLAEVVARARAMHGLDEIREDRQLAEAAYAQFAADHRLLERSASALVRQRLAVGSGMGR